VFDNDEKSLATAFLMRRGGGNREREGEKERDMQTKREDAKTRKASHKTRRDETTRQDNHHVKQKWAKRKRCELWLCRVPFQFIVCWSLALAPLHAVLPSPSPSLPLPLEG
jgi:hypothetical protein